MGAVARTPDSLALDGELTRRFRFRDADHIVSGAPLALPIPHVRRSRICLPRQPLGLDPADRLAALARLKPAAGKLAERTRHNDFIARNDIGLQAAGRTIRAALVVIAVEIDFVAGR